MNIERFYAIAEALLRELEHTEQTKQLEVLAEALATPPPVQATTTAQQKAAAKQQEASKARQHLEVELDAAWSNDFSPAWRQSLEELGISQLLGTALWERIDKIVTRNEITPRAAAEELAKLKEASEHLADALRRVTTGLKYFAVGKETLKPAEFEVGFLIPRGEVKNELEALGKEFIRLRRIVGPLQELATGTRPELDVRSIASSDFQVFLSSDPAVALVIATVIERLIASYEKVMNIRLAYAKLKEADVSESTLAHVSEDARDSIKQDVAELVDELLEERGDKIVENRANELKADLKNALLEIADRIDRGFNVEVRAGVLPPPSKGDEGGPDETAADAELRATADAIASKSKRLQFINTSGRPILQLSQPDDLAQSDELPAD